MKLNKEILKVFEEEFPKGDKARGKALILHSVAQVEINRIKEKIEYILLPREKNGNKGRTKSRKYLLKKLLKELEGEKQ